MPGFVLKVGDVFAVAVGTHQKKYFQYIGDDNTMLGSHVLRAFAKTFEATEEVDLTSLVLGTIDFHTHGMVRTGVKMGLWTKVGNGAVAAGASPVFRHTDDYGRMPGKEPVALSKNWMVWSPNEPMQRVGELQGKLVAADIGMVMPPHEIVARMTTGAYLMTPFYPSF
ncbi:hypothetical protein GCM10028822_27750 [Hymenobacter terrigena]